MYLHTSSFYLSLSEDDDEPIQIAAINFKLDAAIDCAEDLRNLLSTVRFWGLDSVLNEIVIYCMDSENSETLLRILSEFDLELDYLKLFPELLKLPPEKRVQHCAKFGNLSILRYMVEKEGGDFSAAVSIAAATGGSLPCLKYLVEQNCPVNITAAVAATKHNQLGCLDYLCSIGIAMNYSVTQTAVVYGHLSILKYIDQHGGTWGHPEFTKAAAKGGHVECLQYLIEHGCPVADDITEHAASAPTLTCLQYLVQAGFVLSAATSASAAHASLAHLSYVHALNCPWDENTCVKAASCRAGDVPTLQYAHEHGCPWDARTCAAAARTGNLKALIYAHEHGCPWDETTTFYAARSDEISCFEYAHKHNCPLSKDIIIQANLHDAERCKTYIFENLDISQFAYYDD